MKYDIIIVGAGPAGITAAIYALRADKKVLLLEKEVIGGKISSAPFIENYPGIKEISGNELANQLQEQVITLGGEIKIGEVIEIKIEENTKQIITKKESYECNAVILATGTKYKTLGLPNEDNFIGKGISFCATCDGFFYKNKTVAVIGGGNTAIANAIELSNICKKVYIIQNLDHLTAEHMLINQLTNKENIEIFYQTKLIHWLGEKRLEGIEIEQKGIKKQIKVDGVFLSIGQVPETNWIQGTIDINNEKYIKTNEEMMTNENGIFAAGDCTNKKIRQLTTAVNDGTIAALSAVEYVEKSN